MKKAILLGALVVVAAASCSKSQYLGQKPQKVEKLSPIEIGSSIGTATKSTEGEAAAALLGNKFYVWGQNTKAGQTSSVFNQVLVEYTEEDGWSYVSEHEHMRFWDPDASGYDFIAISDVNELTEASRVLEKVSPKANVYDEGFSIAASDARELANIHVTKGFHVNNTHFTSPVTFEFWNPAAKVRVGFYNAIPGYHISVDKFKLSNGEESENTILRGNFYSKASFDVNKDGELTLTGTPAPASDIVLGDRIVNSPNTDQYIGNSLVDASYDTLDDQNRGLYTSVIPVMENGAQITMYVEYRMLAGEEVHSKTAAVTIPAEYTKWKSNHAYTYLFKITDNDLHPITFSAVVKDPDQEESVTTIDGENPVDITISSPGSDVTVNGGVKAGPSTVVYASVANVPVSSYTVSYAFTTNDEINGSNAGSLIAEGDWHTLTLTTHGRYEINAHNVGNYVIRVAWITVDQETSVSTTHHAYLVFKAVA